MDHEYQHDPLSGGTHVSIGICGLLHASSAVPYQRITRTNL